MANIILTTDMFLDPGMASLCLDNANTDALQATINEWEKYYIYQLLSNNTPNTSGLADLFVAECAANNGVPTSARFLFIYNLFNQMVGSKMYSSKGMKYVFKSLIAYHYITENMVYSGSGGITSGNSSASKTLEIQNAFRWAEYRWNDALVSINAIKWWLNAGNANGGGSAQYPEYINSLECNDVFRAKFSAVL